MRYGSLGTGTPCIRICKLNDEGVCTGCYRTIDEIANWLKYTDVEREAIIELLDMRKNILTS